MLNKKNAFLCMFAIFIYLFLTSQLHYLPIANETLSHVRHLLRGFLDMLPLVAWYWFVKTRVIQPSVRRYLVLGSIAMQFSMFVIYLQTVIVTEDVNLMALSVIGIFVPYFIFPVFSLMATLCLGMPEQYKLPKKYWLLPGISFVLALLTFTNYYHEWFFKFEICVDDINRSTVEPRWLCYVAVIFCSVIILWRLIATMHFVNNAGNKKTFTMIMILFVSILLYHIPYLMNGFAPKWEPWGSTQYTFFIEILSWIICMSTGLVPVNSNYDKVFKHSNMEFEIYNKKGQALYPSNHSRLTEDEFTALISEGKYQRDKNTILHMTPLKKKGYVVWKKDVSYINQLVEQQEQLKRQLKEQEILLQNELTMANAKDKLEQRNAIYSKIDEIVKQDIAILDERVKLSAYKEIIQKGIYIKRKSNLLIINEENKMVPLMELKLTMDEMLTGVFDATIASNYLVPLSTEIVTYDIVRCLDSLHRIIMEEKLHALSICIKQVEDKLNFEIQYTSDNVEQGYMEMEVGLCM